MTYNPFGKLFGEVLQVEDLQLLVTEQVAEGYYIEYKREMPKPVKIAHSLASLANTYGGWYIVGVETDEHNVATDISGFAPASNHDPISVIRDLVKHHIDPIPVFFPQVLQLDNGNLVLVVYIPEKQETPFVTKDGRLYRRTHDSSDPVPETSRYALDQLVERGKEVSKRFSNFSKDNRTFSQAEEDGWLKIYISPYPFGLIEYPDIYSQTTLEKVLNESRESTKILFFEDPEINISAKLEFNVAYPTNQSVVLRNTHIENERLNSLEMELDRFGRAKMFIPLQQFDLNKDSLSHMRSSSVRQQILKRVNLQQRSLARTVSSSNRGDLRFFDVGKMWLAIASLVSYYLRWLGDSNTFTKFQVTLELDGVWRCVPFYDLDSWGEHVEQFGLPVSMRNHVRFPSEEDRGRMIDVDRHLWVNLCLDFARAVGLPGEFLAENLSQVILDADQAQKL
jgi:Putative DNA-binding domain